MTASSLQASLAQTFSKKKIQFLIRTLLGVSWASWEVSWAVWGPVVLEKLIDSMTWRIFESPKIVLRPVLEGPGSCMSPKMPKKPRIMIAPTPKRPFFGHKSARQGIRTRCWPAGGGRPAGRPAKNGAWSQIWSMGVAGLVIESLGL